MHFGLNSADLKYTLLFPAISTNNHFYVSAGDQDFAGKSPESQSPPPPLNPINALFEAELRDGTPKRFGALARPAAACKLLHHICLASASQSCKVK